MGNYIIRHKESTVEVGIHTFDGANFVVHFQCTAHKALPIPGDATGQRLAEENVRLADKVLCAALNKFILREHFKERGIGIQPAETETFVGQLNDRLPQHRHVSHRLHFGDVHLQLFLVPVAQAQVLVRTQHEGTLPVRRLMRHLILLDHIAADQDYESKADGQTHRLDGSVELVAG